MAAIRLVRVDPQASGSALGRNQYTAGFEMVGRKVRV